MNSTQNKKLEQVKSETLVIGIDVGSETHYARAFDWRGYELSKKPFKFRNAEQGFVQLLEWMQNIKREHGKDNILAGMEPTGHYWFCLGVFLKDNGIKPVLVNPHHVKKSKELDDNSQSKNDRKDPKVIAGLVKDSRFTEPYIPEKTVRTAAPNCAGLAHISQGWVKKEESVMNGVVEETIVVTEEDVDVKWIEAVNDSMREDANYARKERYHCYRLDIADDKAEWVTSHEHDPLQ